MSGDPRNTVGRPHDFLGPVGVRTDAVLGDRQPRVRRERGAQLRERQQRCQRHRAAGHVSVHVEHGAVRLEVHPSGIEQNALADERDVGTGAAPAPRAISQVGNASTAFLVAGRYGEEGGRLLGTARAIV